jgi:hypothetical protein
MLLQGIVQHYLEFRGNHDSSWNTGSTEKIARIIGTGGTWGVH